MAFCRSAVAGVRWSCFGRGQNSVDFHFAQNSSTSPSDKQVCGRSTGTAPTNHPLLPVISPRLCYPVIVCGSGRYDAVWDQIRLKSLYSIGSIRFDEPESQLVVVVGINCSFVVILLSLIMVECPERAES